MTEGGWLYCQRDDGFTDRGRVALLTKGERL